MQVTSLLSYWPLDEVLVECRDLGGFTFNKRFLLKFRKFPMERHSPVEQIRLKPPLNCTRKQDTWERYRGQLFLSNGKGHFCPTGRAGESWPPSKARSQIFRWNGTEMVRYIWFLTKMSGILSWMKSALFTRSYPVNARLDLTRELFSWYNTMEDLWNF